MGLLGVALAGGAAGLGAGTAEVGKEWTKEIFEKERQDAIGKREEALARLNAGFADTRQDKDIAAADTRQGKEIDAGDRRQDRGFTHAETMQTGQFQHTEDMQRAQQNFQRSESELTRNMTREQITSAERIAAANRSTSLEIAKLGGTVQQDKDGNVLYIGKDGVAKPINDPSTGKPMTGFKDLTPAAKSYADVIKAQLTGLDREELNASTSGDKAALTKIEERRLDLNTKLLNVLTGGIDKAAVKPTGERPPLSSFGPGGAGTETTTSTSYDLQEPPGTPKGNKTHQGERGFGLLQRAQARNQVELDRQQELRDRSADYKDAGY